MKRNIVTFVVLFFLWQVSICAQKMDFLARFIEGNYLLSVPFVDWELSIDLNDFYILKNSLNTESNCLYLLATNRDVKVSISIPKAENKGNHLDCLHFYWEKELENWEKSEKLFKIDTLAAYEKSDIAFVEYDKLEWRRLHTTVYKWVKLHNLHAYLSHEDYWINLHIEDKHEINDMKCFCNVIFSFLLIYGRT